MHRDPIVEEVRKHRLARAAKFNFDLAAIYADAKSREKTSGLTLVMPRKRRKPLSPRVIRSRPCHKDLRHAAV